MAVSIDIIAFCTLMDKKGKVMYKVLGGCDCGNISYLAEMQNEPSSYAPRLCDCNFCTSHGAAYASDSKGTLTIKVKDECEISKYSQGSRNADFLICKNCGVLTNVLFEQSGHIFGAINVRSANDYSKFSEGQVLHLTHLGDKERIGRWKEYWFSDVKIEYENT